MQPDFRSGAATALIFVGICWLEDSVKNAPRAASQNKPKQKPRDAHWPHRHGRTGEPRGGALHDPHMSLHDRHMSLHDRYMSLVGVRYMTRTCRYMTAACRYMTVACRYLTVT